MLYIFTKHAKERLKFRKIKVEEIRYCLKYPDYIKRKNNELLYITKNKNRLLVVITSDKSKIITVYYTSQIKKYLNLLNYE